MSTEKKMNRAKLKVLVGALRQILEELESEIYSDTDSYMRNKYTDYDEIFDDDDDSVINSYRLVNDDDGDGL